MTSFLTSALSRRFRGRQQEFFAAYPCCWLVWEPGVWKPPHKDGSTLAGIPIQTPAPSGVGEALALALIASAARPGQVTVGRGACCDLEINDATLSQTHLLLLEREPGTWTVRDAGSKNGSWLDDVPLIPGVPKPLRNGARVQAAQVCLSFYDPAGMLRRLEDVGVTPARSQRIVPIGG